MDPNLIISDEYLQEVAEACRSNGKDLEELMQKYVDILNHIRSDAIDGGSVALEIDNYISGIKQLNGNLTKFSSTMENYCKNMQVDIDDADSYLF